MLFEVGVLCHILFAASVVYYNFNVRFSRLFNSVLKVSAVFSAIDYSCFVVSV